MRRSGYSISHRRERKSGTRHPNPYAEGLGFDSSGSSGAGTSFRIACGFCWINKHSVLTRSSSTQYSAQLIERKDPIYPVVAKEAHVSGAVEVHFHIRPDGTVHDVGVVRGNRLLSEAAIEAVQQWRYKPAPLSGTPVESDGCAVLNFEYQ